MKHILLKLLFLCDSRIFRKYLFLLLCLNSIFPIPFTVKALNAKNPLKQLVIKSAYARFHRRVKTAQQLSKNQVSMERQVWFYANHEPGECIKLEFIYSFQVSVFCLVNENIIIFMHRKLKPFFSLFKQSYYEHTLRITWYDL